jgi:uncharacterized membrane protein
MPKVHKSIDIKAPVKKVFSYLEDPRNEPDWMVSLMDVTNVEGKGVGTHFNWSYKMAGMRLNGEAERVEDIPEKRIVDKTKGGVESTWVFNFSSHGDTTTLDMDIDYSIPVPVIGKMAERLILKRNERESEQSILNIKENIEC